MCQIQILDSQIVPTPSESYTPGAPKYGLDFIKIAEATHSYPVTRLLWEPPSSQKQSTDLLATSGDHLRLWSLPSETPVASPGNSITRPTNHARDMPASKLTPLALLSNSKTPEHYPNSKKICSSCVNRLHNPKHNVLKKLNSTTLKRK